jgi:asparagine synthase (glutamine-hydrolysing)
MEWEDELGKAFKEVIREIPDNVGVLFSGGIDSSFLAYLLRKLGKSVHLYTAGTVNSHDFLWASMGAELLDLPLSFLARSDIEIKEAIMEMKRMTGETNPLIILIELPLFFISQDSTETTLVSGQGADELFLGYKKYETDDTSKTDLRKLQEEVIPLELKICRPSKKVLIYPYLDERIVRIASGIPYGQNIRKGQRKFVLRSTASKLQMNEKLVWKQKKASQYSSGFKDAVARMAKKEKKKVYEFINDL